MTRWTEDEQKKVSALCAHAFACGMHAGILSKIDGDEDGALKRARVMGDDAVRELIVAVGETAHEPE